MREAAFIKENLDKWERIDHQSLTKDTPAEVMADNLVEIADDLSYARTFYNESQTVRYLNQIASRYFIDVTKYKKRDKGAFLNFWKTELPLIMYKRRKEMLLAFFAILAGALLGIFSQQQENDFANMIMGDHYMHITKDNIAKGDPMGIYKSSAEAPMFIGIATNNIRVSFLAFIAGIFLSVGTVYILFSNGVMLGVFQYFFYQQGLLKVSALSIWLHGTLEISAIIIAGGAGMVLGNSILFPGTYKRSQSLRKAASDAVKIILGLIPVFIVAAFIESYLTRLTEMPIYFNLIIISLSALFIVWYFILYPHMLNAKLNKTN